MLPWQPRRTENCEHDIRDFQMYNPSHRSHSNCCEKRYFNGMDATHIALTCSKEGMKQNRWPNSPDLPNLMSHWISMKNSARSCTTDPRPKVQAIKEYAGTWGIGSNVVLLEPEAGKSMWLFMLGRSCAIGQETRALRKERCMRVEESEIRTNRKNEPCLRDHPALISQLSLAFPQLPRNVIRWIKWIHRSDPSVIFRPQVALALSQLSNEYFLNDHLLVKASVACGKYKFAKESN